MDSTSDVGNWMNLHSETELTSDRTAPCPVVVDFLSRKTPLQTNTPHRETVGLDIGFGLGRNIMFLLESNFCHRFIGIDQTEAALRKGRLHAISRGLVDRCDLLLLTAGSPFPFPDDSVDFALDIMAASTFISNPEARKAYGEEICRILKPGGVFFVFTGKQGGDVRDKLDSGAANDEPGTFRRSMDGAVEKTYTAEEIKDLLPSLSSVVLESQSHYLRAFGEQVVCRPEGFWFGIFRKPQNSDSR